MDDKTDPNKLNKSRTYGTVFGEPHVGFEQDGKYFDHSGKLYIKPDGKQPEKPEDLPKETLKLRTDMLRKAFNERAEKHGQSS